MAPRSSPLSAAIFRIAAAGADEPGLGDLVFPEGQGGLEGPDVFGVGEGDAEELRGRFPADVRDEGI